MRFSRTSALVISSSSFHIQTYHLITDKSSRGGSSTVISSAKEGCGSGTPVRPLKTQNEIFKEITCWVICRKEIKKKTQK